MKKLLFLSIFTLFALVSANVFGQTNTGAKPSIGSKHQYWVNGTGIGAITSGKEGTLYKWWLSDGSNNLTTALTAGTDFTPTSGYNSQEEDLNGIEITWNPSSYNKTYYLVVEEAGKPGSDLCANLKAYAIQPQNNFTVTFAALTAAEASSVGDNLDHCAPDIVLSASGTTITYDYKGGDYLFKIVAKDLYTKWTMDYLFDIVKGNAVQDIKYSLDGGSTYTAFSATGADFEIPANASGEQTVFVKVNLNNGTSGGTHEEGTTAQTIKLTLSDIKDAGANPVTKVFKSNGTDEFSGAAEQTQTVKARPATSDIQSN